MKILIKLSGKVLESPELRLSLAKQVRILESRGVTVVMVHGAGKQLTEYCRAHDIPVVQKGGRRITSQPVLDSAVKVFSAVNREICSSMLASGVNAVGFSAFDGNLTSCHRRPPIAVVEGGEKIDFGSVAEIEVVAPEIIDTLWSGGFVPIVSCLCADSSGSILNINADTLAAELAVTLAVDSLVSVSDVEGLFMDLDDPGSLIPSLSLEEASELLARGVFSDGMIPKIQNAINALERGVPRYHLVSGTSASGLLQTPEGSTGTVISATEPVSKSTAE